MHIIFTKLVRPSKTPNNVFSNEKSMNELITVSTILLRRECNTLFEF